MDAEKVEDQPIVAESKPQEVVVRQQKAPMRLGVRGLQFQDFDALYRFAVCVQRSGLAPKGMTTPEAIAVAMEMGLEIGLSPMQAIQNIAVINGRPGVFGDAAKALCDASGLMEAFAETIEGEGDGRKAVCTVKRVGRTPATTTFSVTDAKRAKLWGKDGPWTQYPDRMLMFRARGFALRDVFPDVLKGLVTVEELMDYPALPETSGGVKGVKERLGLNEGEKGPSPS